jgi:hypothetical protein
MKKALVVIGGAPMNSYTSMRAIWAIQDWCRSPGPMQVLPWPAGPCRMHTLQTLSMPVWIPLAVLL